MSILHAFKSARPNSADSNIVSSNAWNNDHVVTDIETTGGNFKWDNTIKRIAIGFSGIYTSVRATVMESAIVTSWAGLTKLWYAMRINVNNFPSNAEFGSDLAPIPQGITGSMDIPASVTFANHGAGVAGYARSASTALGGVGTFGAGLVAANSVIGAWGANLLVSNTATIHNPVSHANPPGPGYNLTNLYGIEIDNGVHPLAGGGTPNISGRGIYMVIGGSIQPLAAVYNCIDMDNVNFAACRWNNAINISDGVAATGLNLGTATQGTESGSQPIKFKSRDSVGTVNYSQIFSNAGGDFIMLPANGHLIVSTDSDGSPITMVGLGQFRVAKKLIFDKLTPPATAAGPGDIGHILYDDNFLYIRVNATTWKRTPLSTW